MKLNTSKKILTLLVILYPIISIYGYERLNFGMVLFIISIIPLILKKGFKIELPKYMVLFFIYFLLTRFLWGLTVSIKDAISVTAIGFFITLGFTCKYFDIDYGIKVYRIIGFISCIFFLFQEITFALRGYSISGILPNVPLTFNTEFYDFDYRIFLTRYFRQSSFFREPAYFAQFLLPLLAIELFDEKKTKISYINALFITFIIVLSATGTGTVGLITIWLLWLFLDKNKGIPYDKIAVLLIIGFFSFIYGPGYIKSEKGISIQKRIEAVKSVDEYSISSFTRVFRGYLVYNEYNFFEKIVGINNPKLQNSKVMKSQVKDMFGKELYFNGIQSLLIVTGILGLSLMFLSYYFMWKNNSKTGKVLIITLVILSFSEAIFLNPQMLLFITLIYSMQKQKKINSYQNKLSYSTPQK